MGSLRRRIGSLLRVFWWSSQSWFLDADILSYAVPYSVFNSTSTSEQHELTKRVEEQEKLVGEACAKKLNQKVNLFHEFPLSLIENIILPNSGSLLIVRFEGDASCEYQEHDASRGVLMLTKIACSLWDAWKVWVHDDLRSNSEGSSMNNIYIWKAYQVYFPTDQTARDLELSIKSYGYSSACCTFRPINARELTKLMIPRLVRHLGKISSFAMTFQRLTRVPFSSFTRIQVVSINEIEVRKVWIQFGFGISIKIGFGISSTVRIKKVITFTNGVRFGCSCTCWKANFKPDPTDTRSASDSSRIKRYDRNNVTVVNSEFPFLF